MKSPIVKKVIGKNKGNINLKHSDHLPSKLSWEDAQSSEFSFCSGRGSSDNSSAFLRNSNGKNSISSSGVSSRTVAYKPRRSTDSSAVVDELNRLKFDWLNLYGRENELDALRRAYARLGNNCDGDNKTVVLSKGTGLEHATFENQQQFMNLFLLGGQSGTGKSAIIKEFSVEGSTKDKHTIFVSGKFDQYLPTPYAPFKSSLSQLCSKIQSHEFFNDQLKEEILQVFGGGGEKQQSYKLLLDLIPNIGELVHHASLKNSSENVGVSDKITNERTEYVPQSSYRNQEDAYDIVKSEKKFKFLLQRFLAAVCKSQHKVVLILDDIQWIDRDNASLKLLEMILLDPALYNSLLIICSYRDNEMSSEHPFFQRLKIIEEKRGKQAEKMTVGNLSFPAVHSFVTDLLNVDREKTEELAKIAHKKVEGNAFFLIQFLTALRDGGYLQFNIGTMKWTWDDIEIRKSTVVADNVLTVLMKKMEKLPCHLRKVLQIAACLGSSFEEIVITIVHTELRHSHLLLDSSSQDNVASVEMSSNDILQDIVKEGLLDCFTNRFGTYTYQFAHDQIELAANSLLDEDNLPELKLTIGRVLYDNRANFDFQSLVFLVVDLWNQGDDLITEPEQKQVLIRLNQEAGMRAIESSAFEASTVYLRKAIDLIPKEKRWSGQHSLALDLYNSLIKAEYSAGSWGLLRKIIDEVLVQKGLSVLDKQVAYSTMISVLVVKEHDHVAAINYTVDVLAQLGTRFRPQLGLLAVIGALIKTKNLVKKIPLETLLEKEYMTNPIKKAAIDTLSAVNSSLYAANPALLLCTVLKTLRWSLKYGLSKETPKCIGFYALLEMAMGNPKGATNTAKLALKLAEKQNLMNTEFAPVSSVYGFVFPWTNPLHVCGNHLLNGYNDGLQNGDLQYAFMSICLYCFFCFIEGKPLVSLEANMRDYCRQMKECNQSLQLQFMSLYWQTALNLMGRSDDPLILTGEAMSQDEMLQAADKDKNPPLRAQVQCHRLLLAVYYRNFDLAGELIGPASVIAAVNPGNPIIWRTALFEGITAFELFRTKKYGSNKWKSIALRALAKVQKWVDGGNMNCVPMLFILQAEKAAMDKNYTDSRDLFNKAIATAARNGLRNDRAIANERCSDMCLHIGDACWARDYLQKAHKAYEDMEAFGKVDQLEKDNPWLRPCLIDIETIGGNIKSGEAADCKNSLCDIDMSTLATPFSVSTLTKSIDMLF